MGAIASQAVGASFSFTSISARDLLSYGTIEQCI